MDTGSTSSSSSSASSSAPPEAQVRVPRAGEQVQVSSIQELRDLISATAKANATDLNRHGRDFLFVPFRPDEYNQVPDDDDLSHLIQNELANNGLRKLALGLYRTGLQPTTVQDTSAGGKITLQHPDGVDWTHDQLIQNFNNSDRQHELLKAVAKKNLTLIQYGVAPDAQAPRPGPQDTVYILGHGHYEKKYIYAGKMTLTPEQVVERMMHDDLIPQDIAKISLKNCAALNTLHPAFIQTCEAKNAYQGVEVIAYGVSEYDSTLLSKTEKMTALDKGHHTIIQSFHDFEEAESRLEDAEEAHQQAEQELQELQKNPDASQANLEQAKQALDEARAELTQAQAQWNNELMPGRENKINQVISPPVAKPSRSIAAPSSVESALDTASSSSSQEVSSSPPPVPPPHPAPRAKDLESYRINKCLLDSYQSEMERKQTLRDSLQRNSSYHSSHESLSIRESIDSYRNQIVTLEPQVQAFEKQHAGYLAEEEARQKAALSTGSSSSADPALAADSGSPSSHARAADPALSADGSNSTSNNSVAAPDQAAPSSPGRRTVLDEMPELALNKRTGTALSRKL